MFIGEFKHTIDEKGRLAIPAKLRSKLGKGAVVTKGIDNCLAIFPHEAWLIIAEKYAKLPMGQAKARAIARHMLAGAMEVEFDNQGRITLPEYLRDFAGLGKKAVVAGLFDRLEIWDEAAWENYKQGTEKQSSEIAEQLSELGV